MSVGSCDPGAQGCKSSLWDLLEPELQHHVIVLALGPRKSEAKQKLEIINSMHTAYRFSDFELPSNCNGMCSELQKLLRKICTDRQCLLATGAGQDGEIAELQVSLQNIINPVPLVFDFGDMDLTEVINSGPEFEYDYSSESDADAQGL